MDYMNQDDVITLDEKKLEPVVRIGISTVIGTREKQQDTVFGFEREPYYIAAVCDGMGGLSGGEVASRTAMEILAEDFLELGADENIPGFLKEEAVKLSDAVYHLRNEEGEFLEAGTTIVTVIIKGNSMYWMAVGDSKIFYIRKNQIFSITREHNYRLSLDILKMRGDISEEDYETEAEKGEALISYLGVDNLSLVDGNEEAIILKKGDMLLLCSDGLYKSLDEQQILQMLWKYKNVQEAATALTECVMKRKKSVQDNASVVLVQYS